MLAPDDRAALREELRPTPGDELDAAVATTFTLDLTAALVAPLAFAAHDLAGTADPVAVLEAVRSAAERIDVFCQVGHVRVPATASDLMAFLEPMVHEVQAPIPGYLFHPKLWVLRYRGPDGHRYRLLCGTRNLTDAVAWDAVVRLDGWPAGGRPRRQNRPLVELVRALPGLAVRQIDPGRRHRVEELADDLATVEWENPPGVSEVAFHVLGLRRRRGTHPLVGALAGSRHLVVSPFLDDEGLASIVEGSGDVTVISRAEALEQLSPSTLSGLPCCRVVSPLAGLAQPDESAEPRAGAGTTLSAGSVLGGLHAKLYVAEWARQARLFVGSANATVAGLHERNVEVVVEMLAGRKVLGVDRFVGADAPMATLLEPYEPTGGAAEPADEATGRELERLLRRIAAMSLTAAVAPEGDRWREAVTSDARLDIPSDTDVVISLLTVAGTAQRVGADGGMKAVFGELPLADVTPFVVVRARRKDGALTVERSTVVRADLRGDPPGRFDEVIARQVDTPDKFLRFVALLLALGEGSWPIVSSTVRGDGKHGILFVGPGPGLFELLVRAVADRPQAIADLDRLIDRLAATERGRAVLPEGFADLWATVRAAHAELAGVVN